MSETEFRHWIKFYEVRPFGDEWEDYRFGVLAANIMSMWGGGGEGISIQKCMPVISGREYKIKRMSPQAIAETLREVTREVDKANGRRI
jgi:hypothetical protein